MNGVTPAYMEIVDFIAGNNPQAVLQFRPSAAAEGRLKDLLERQDSGELSVDDKAELDHFMELEHILRMAKARARQILSSAG